MAEITVWAVIHTDENGDEGIPVVALGRFVEMPMLTTNPEVIQYLRSTAIRLKKRFGGHWRLVKFTSFETIESITDGGLRDG